MQQDHGWTVAHPVCACAIAYVRLPPALEVVVAIMQPTSVWIVVLLELCYWRTLGVQGKYCLSATQLSY